MQPTYWAQPGIFDYSVLKKASPERIEELLRVLNWIASPSGTQEHLLMWYGVKDVDYTPDAAIQPRQVDVARLRRELRNQGVYLQLPSEGPAAATSVSQAAHP